MIEALKTWTTLQWSSTPKFHPLPAQITREFIQTPTGEIELLISNPQANPRPNDKHSPPIFFVHGGAGHASVWLEWMTHFSTTYSGRTYAFSLRNHGASHAVPFFRMVWQTSIDELADDLVAAFNEVTEREGEECLIVAHSSGGGLAQYVLCKGLITARGLALVGAVPHWGNVGIYFNWFRRIDPFFSLRSLFHAFHPNSPYSTPRLVRNAFFGPAYPEDKVGEFAKWLSCYEAMWWPFGMAGKGWGIQDRVWLKPVDILRNLGGWRDGHDKVLVMMGTEDKIMQGSEDRMVEEYRSAIKELQQEKKLDVVFETAQQGKVVVDEVISEQYGCGVRLVEVKDAGHHTQNDVQWREAADALQRFAEQL